MDPALLRERELFLKRAKATPSVEKRKLKPDDANDKKAKKPKVRAAPPKPANNYDYKTSSGSSSNKFGVLTKIVKHMKTKHQSGMNDPLDITEILDETCQTDCTSKIRHWLTTEALLNNPKITVVKEDGINKFCFKPKYEIHDKKGLLKLLKNYDIHGKGGILLEDIEESLPNMPKVLKALQDHIVFVNRPIDKKQVVFYNDKYCRFTVDEDFRKLWRSVSVDIDEGKIEEHLKKQGITSMEISGFRKVSSVPRRKKGNKPRSFKKHNDHLNGILQDYTENPPKK